MIPRGYGGLEWSLPETVRLFEALAWADANVGWCVNLGAGANLFSGYFNSETALAIFNGPWTWCAGSGALSGTARRTKEGYLLNGRWKYASGANHATHFTANAWLLDEQNHPVNGPDQRPLFRSFLFPAAQVINYNNWRAIGLKATSSNDFEVKDIFVPEAHSFSLRQPSAFAAGPLYKFPFEQMAVVNMACMLTGIACHFMDLYKALAADKKPLHASGLLKDHETAKVIFNKVAADFNKAREGMYRQLEQIWEGYAAGAAAANHVLNELSVVARHAAQAARDLINDLYPLCGMNILDPESAMNKVWRDAATAGQHYLLSPLSAP